MPEAELSLPSLATSRRVLKMPSKLPLKRFSSAHSWGRVTVNGNAMLSSAAMLFKEIKSLVENNLKFQFLHRVATSELPIGHKFDFSQSFWCGMRLDRTMSRGISQHVYDVDYYQLKVQNHLLKVEYYSCNTTKAERTSIVRSISVKSSLTSPQLLCCVCLIGFVCWDCIDSYYWPLPDLDLGVCSAVR